MKSGYKAVCVGAMGALVLLCVNPTTSSAQSSAPADSSGQAGQSGQASATKPHRMTAQEYAAKQAAIRKAAYEQPTPKMSDGHPDLSGVWGSQGPGGAVTKDAEGNVHVIFPSRQASSDTDPDGKTVYYYQQLDSDLRRSANANKPPYKEELSKKIAQLDRDSNQLDPATNCVPSEPPRAFPTQIFATPHYVVFLFGGENSSHYRLIPTDGGPHPAEAFATYMGDSVGHWEGDTLVIDVTNYNDKTWLGSAGWIHSDKMHVVERFTRRGNVIHYEATVEDPEVFTRPWVMTPRDVMVMPSANYVYEDLPCVDTDRAHFVNHDHI